MLCITELIFESVMRRKRLRLGMRYSRRPSWEALRANALNATALHFEDDAVPPRLVQLHYVSDELIPVEERA
jgi:hypothetical protein